MHKQFVMTGITALNSGKNWKQFYTYTLERTFSKGRQYLVILTSKSKLITCVMGAFSQDFRSGLFRLMTLLCVMMVFCGLILTKQTTPHFLSSHTPEMIIAPGDELEPKIKQS
jgi:hypothetical protein